MKKKQLLFLVLAVLLLGVGIFLLNSTLYKQLGKIDAEEKGDFLKNALQFNIVQDLSANISGKNNKKNPVPTPVLVPTPTNSFSDSFSLTYGVQETGSILESANPNWWVNSGGWFESSLGIGRTLQGDLVNSDRWYKEYRATNPIDTDNGLHPQNIFRLVQRGQWSNLTQQTYFKINKLNFSSSPNRNASNGFFLFNRYKSGDNLYYTGLRVDGALVIKKKINGKYYTMGYKSIYSNGSPYNRSTNPNLIPINAWVGLKSQVTTNSDNTVSVKIYLDQNRTNNWVLAFEAKDNGITYGGGAILGGGYAGIRTDFMDVEFDTYKLIE